MSSGGLPDFFSAAASSSSAGRPVNASSSSGSVVIQQQQQQQPVMYHRPQFLPDHSQSGLGKRTLAEFQNQRLQFQHQNPLLLLRQQQQQGVGAFPMRSVKPRIYQNPSPISPLSPIDLLPEMGAAFMGRRQNSVGFGRGSVVPTPTTNLSHHHNRVFVAGNSKEEDTETEKKMMNRLHELERQLLGDDNDDARDSVSVITGNEWSDTIQNLIVTNQKPPPPPQQVNTSSPTSSSSSCSSVVASPLTICAKQSLIEAAAAIADGKSESAAEIVTRLTQSSNPRGTPEQRLAYYMSLALKSKLTSGEGQKSANEIRSSEHYESVQLLYQHSSCFKLGFLAANLAIIEATADVKSLHVVDFDMGDGAQYHNLLQLLSLRKSGKPTSVRITAVDVGENGGGGGGLERWSIIAKEKLSQLSERVGVPLELRTLHLGVGDVSRESLCSNPDEVVAVNLAYSLSKLPDESVSTENKRDELLRRVKGLEARIVTVVEEEMNCNTAPLQTRVAECCSFYGALLESMDSGVMEAERIRVEEGLGRRMVNTVACEGGDRVERCEVLGKWRARMGMAGFELKPVSQNVVDSLSSRINSNSGGTRVGCPLFVKEANGGVCFGWMGRILTVTSAWR